MDMLQELEFIVGPEVAGVQDGELPFSSAPNFRRAWSLVPTASPSGALRRRLKAAARGRIDLQTGDTPQTIV
jgi:hypothetical protein